MLYSVDNCLQVTATLQLCQLLGRKAERSMQLPVTLLMLTSVQLCSGTHFPAV